MRSEDNEVRQEVYYIPANYEDAGGVLNGKLSKRNAIDAGVFCGPILFINLKFIFPNVSLQVGLIILLCSVLPLLALCALGIGGESLSQILFAYIRYRKGRRKLSYTGFTNASSVSGKTKFNLNKLIDDAASYGFKRAFKIAKESMAKPVDEGNDVQNQSSRVKQPVKRSSPKEAAPTSGQSQKLMGSALKEKFLQKLELDDEDY